MTHPNVYVEWSRAYLYHDIRFTLDKKRKAITRVRNESGALQAELQRTLDTHEQEKAMLEELKNELERETELRIKAKNALELEFKRVL